jgi:hypothetical protein
MAHNLIQPPPRGNVLPFPARTGARLPGPAPQPSQGDPWRAFTRTLILAKASAGTLDPGILEALLDHAGVTP